MSPVLILAMTKMKSGICTAGLTPDPAGANGLRWVRPVKDFDTLLPGDMADADGHLAACGEWMELNLLRPRPRAPHVEDWLMDCVRRRPRVVGRLAGSEWAQFLAANLDPDPGEVLERHVRSLCLVRPETVWAHFFLDGYSGKYEARMGFELAEGGKDPRVLGERGTNVTDLRWLALGQKWLGSEGGTLSLDHRSLLDRLGADDLYLAIGLSRVYRGEHWPMVVGVHVVPDHGVEVGLDDLG